MTTITTLEVAQEMLKLPAMSAMEIAKEIGLSSREMHNHMSRIMNRDRYDIQVIKGGSVQKYKLNKIISVEIDKSSKKSKLLSKAFESNYDLIKKMYLEGVHINIISDAVGINVSTLRRRLIKCDFHTPRRVIVNKSVNDIASSRTEIQKLAFGKW